MRFFDIKIKLKCIFGRFQRCPQCKKLLLNRGQSLSYDLYIEDGLKPKGQYKNTTYCKKCSKESKQN